MADENYAFESGDDALAHLRDARLGDADWWARLFKTPSQAAPRHGAVPREVLSGLYDPPPVRPLEEDLGRQPEPAISARDDDRQLEEMALLMAMRDDEGPRRMAPGAMTYKPAPLGPPRTVTGVPQPGRIGGVTSDRLRPTAPSSPTPSAVTQPETAFGPNESAATYIMSALSKLFSGPSSASASGPRPTPEFRVDKNPRQPMAVPRPPNESIRRQLQLDDPNSNLGIFKRMFGF